MEHGNLQMHLHPYGSLPTDILNFEHKVQWVDHQPCKLKATGLIPSIVIGELKATTDVTERKDGPSWDYDDKESCWKWKRPPPLSRKTMDTRNPEERKRARQAKKKAENLSGRDSLLKAACGHDFCKSCLEGAFSGQTFVRERTCAGRKNLRAQKNVMKCPDLLCLIDISDSIKNPQVNRGLMDTIESLQLKAVEIDEEMTNEEFAGTDEQSETVSIYNGKADRQDDSKVVQNPPENKYKSVYKKRKTNNEPLLSNPDGVGKDDRSSEEQKAKSVSGGTKDEMEVENSTPTSESNLKITAAKDSPSLNDDALE